MGKICKILNKLNGYIKTYGFFKGIKFSLERSKQNKRELERIREELPNIEKELKDELESFKEEDKEHPYVKGEVAKNIFVFWWNGFDRAPKIVQKCFERIKELYHDYKVFGISKDNVEEFIGKDSEEIEWLKNKRITIQMFSDILRFKLIYKFGGVWIDSTALVVNRVDFEEYLKRYGLFTVADNNSHKFLNYKGFYSSWSGFFWGGLKGSPLFNCGYNLFIAYLSKDLDKPYFLIDSLIMLMKVYGIGNGILSSFNNQVFDIFYVSNNLNSRRKDVDFSKMVVQKLNWRINLDKFSSKALINRVFSYKGE